MKKNVLLSILIFLALNNFAQQEDSLLKNFKFRIDHYRAVNFSLGGSGNYNKAQPSSSGSIEQSIYGGNAGVNIYTIKSADRLLQTSFGNLGIDFSKSNNSTLNPASTARSLNVQPEYRINNKWFSSSSAFFELDLHGAANLQSNKYSSGGSSNTQVINLYNADITLGIGKGRQEDISAMQNALWLYKELQESKSISKAFSYDDLRALGNAINQANNTRILDSRRRIKYILKSVDEYLQQKNLVSHPDINYFTSLNDILFFPIYSPRKSGTEKFIKLTPGINSSYYTTTSAPNKLQNKYDFKYALLSAGINTQKPLSLTRQVNYGFAAKFSYGKSNYNFKQFNDGQLVSAQKGSSDLKQAGLYLVYEYSLYPNTRTRIDFNAQTENGYQKIDETSKFYSSSTASVNLNYFINYQTYFTLSTGGTYNKNLNQFVNGLIINPVGTSLFINAGLNISL